MASGHSHDRATWALSLPFGVLWWPWLGLTGSLVAAGCFLAGGLLLSPDLDTRSNATRRWGALKLLWWPYRRLLSHRSVISHTPLIGSAGRLLYLAVLVVVLGLLAKPLGAPQPAQLLGSAQWLWQHQRSLLIAALAGVEASAWLHLIQDGDPVPRLPRLLRQWTRKPKARRRSRRPTRMGRHKRAS